MKGLIIGTLLLVATLIGVGIGYTFAGGTLIKDAFTGDPNDKNANHIWDHVEDFIDVNYPRPVSLKNSLYQIAYSTQEYAETGRLKNLEREAALTRNAIECIYSLVGQEEAVHIIGSVKGRVLDSNGKWSLYLKSEKEFGLVYAPQEDEKQWAYSCSFVPERFSLDDES